jgi:anaerobic dimethyl sulfoxide reductase subunit B (iron-sulfur subunit)
VTQIGFYFDQTLCIGCYACAVACKDWHDINAGPVNFLRVKTIEKGKFPNPFLAYLVCVCYHCVNPPCVPACPVDAITKREFDGTVVVDREKCVGNKECSMFCLKACPWDAPQFGPEEGARMQKCDFCLERRELGRQAICVEACPMSAIDSGPVEELKAKYRGIVEAEGFWYSRQFQPSILFKPKRER